MNLVLLSKSEYLHKSALTVQLLVLLGTVFFFFMLLGFFCLFVSFFLFFLKGWETYT